MAHIIQTAKYTSSITLAFLCISDSNVPYLQSGERGGGEGAHEHLGGI